MRKSNNPYDRAIEEDLYEGLEKERTRLREFTKECRVDMHEPREQELTAIVTGYCFDNANGSEPRRNFCEKAVRLILGL